jgi:hypothetical protein
MWDYKTIKLQTEFGFLQGTEFDEVALETKLCQLGQQGWELVSIFDIEKVKGGSKFVIAVLKRPRPA